jgi:hypothetical protein
MSAHEREHSHIIGGTSLSKGFGLIERFSEDLDLKIEPGTVTALPPVSNWKSDGAKATAERRAFFGALSGAFVAPGCRVEFDDVPHAGAGGVDRERTPARQKACR